MLAKQKLLWLAALLLAVPPVWSQTTCPPQVWKDPVTCPATLDLTRIPTDPNTGKPALLNWVFCTVGKTWTYSGTYCNPDGDPLVVSSSSGTLTAAAGKYTISGPAGVTPGILYIKIYVTEQLTTAQAVAGQIPSSRLGIIAVIVLPPNPLPILTDAGPTAPNWTVWPYPQQRVVMEQYKRTGVLWKNTWTGS